jgi:hypothetical protein
MLYVYGIVDAPGFPVIVGEGMSGQDIEPLDYGNFAAAISPVCFAHFPPTPQNVWRHERAIEKLMRQHTVLPLRFGTVCEGETVLKKFLMAHNGSISTDIDRLRGKCEIALHVFVDRLEREDMPLSSQANDRPVGRGTTYLRGRLRDYRKQAERERACKCLEPTVQGALSGIGVDVLFQLPNTTAETLCAACLIDKNGMTDFDHALDRLHQTHTNLLITYTGPWAPYSFVTTTGVATL